MAEKAREASVPAPAPGPIRTCVGCRRRDSDARLLRIVHDPVGHALVPDPLRRAGGRGAWVHRDERCITTALDRRAFTRALRIDGTASHDAVSRVLGTEGPGRGEQREGSDQTR